MLQLSLFLPLIVFTFSTTIFCAETFEEVYKQGISAYNNKHWSECEKLISKSIELYKDYVERSVDCYLQCDTERITTQNENTVNRDTIKSSEDLRLSYYAASISINICFTKCQEIYDITYEVTHVAFLEFGIYKPYDFLHFCAYKIGNNELAAGAIQTYYLRHQTCENTQKNMEFYRTVPGMDQDHFVDLDQKRYQKHYMLGIKAYEDSNWSLTITEMTMASHLYLREELRCRTLCHIIHDNNTFVTSVSGREKEELKCQYECATKLGVYIGRDVPHYYATHFHYKQFANYQLDKMEEAMSDIASYLLFAPSNEVMMSNKLYYTDSGYAEELFTPDKVMISNKLYYTDSGYDEELFIPYKDAVEYWNVRKRLEEVMTIIELDSVKTNEPPDTSEPPHQDEDDLSEFEQLGVKMITTGTTLSGKTWVVAEGFLLIHHCQLIEDLIQLSSTTKDGTSTATMAHILQYVEKHTEEMLSLQVLMNRTQLIKRYVESEVRTAPLYISGFNFSCSQHPGSDMSTVQDETCTKDLPCTDTNYT